MSELPEWAQPDSQAPTPDLAEFRRLYAKDDNLWWRVACGHHQNLFDAAVEQLDELREQYYRLENIHRLGREAHRQFVQEASERGYQP